MGYKPNIASGRAQLFVDGAYVGDCEDSQDGVRMRCNKEVAHGLHHFQVKVTQGSFAIDHFDVFTGQKE